MSIPINPPNPTQPTLSYSVNNNPENLDIWTKLGINIYNTSLGSVGIGTTNPSTFKLNVLGSLNASSLYGDGANITNVPYSTITGKPTNFQADWNSTIINKPSIYNQTEINNLLSAKEDDLTFNAPLTRSTNTIGINLNSYVPFSALTSSNYVNFNQLLSSNYTPFSALTSSNYVNFNQLLSSNYTPFSALTSSNYVNFSQLLSSNYTPFSALQQSNYVNFNQLLSSNYTPFSALTSSNYVNFNQLLSSNYTPFSALTSSNYVNFNQLLSSNYTPFSALTSSNYVNFNQLLSSNYTPFSALTSSNYVSFNQLNSCNYGNDTNISNLIYDTIYTSERPYPPKLFTSSSSQSSITYLGQTPIYYETINLNTIDISYGSGTYEIYSSENNTTSISITGTGNNVSNVVNDDNYSYAFFASNGTFTTNSNLICDILIVGGGGGGGFDGAGGGGGGQVLYYTDNSVSFKSGNSITLTAGTYNINIGSGGTGQISSITTNGTNGGTSTIINASTSTTILSAKGGGGGGSRNNVGNGGDVGGAGGNGHANNGASQISNNGGGSGGTNSGGTGGGGGGGGANTSGTSKNGENNQPSRAGNGGAGVDINITGANLGVGGGGGGGSYAYVGGSATHGGGSGNITNRDGSAQAGTANTGGGGGSGGRDTGNPQGKNGGTGVVIIRYLKTANQTKKELFNFITNEVGSEYGSFNYNSTTGNYLSTDRYIKNDYYGDFLVVKLPSQIILNRFRIYSRPSFIERAPSLLRLYGSLDNINWEEIPEGSITTALVVGDYSLGYYEKTIANISKFYMYFGIVVNKIIAGNSNANNLNFTEFQLYGKEVLNRPPIYVSSNVFNSRINNFVNFNQLLSSNYATYTGLNSCNFVNSNQLLSSNYITSNVNSLVNYTRTGLDGAYLLKTGGTISGNITVNNITLASAGKINSYDDFHYIQIDQPTDTLTIQEFGKIVFSTGINKTERVRINSSGISINNGDNSYARFGANSFGYFLNVGSIDPFGSVSLYNSTTAGIYTTSTGNIHLNPSSSGNIVVINGYNSSANLAVGNGATTADAKLHVGSGSASTGNIYQKYYSIIINDQTPQYQTLSDVCAIFESSVWCKSKYSVSSDERIKKNIQDINDDNALQKILLIQPKIYEYIDKVERGDKIVYGFIAQQIKEIIPEAIQIEKSIIPNIMKFCNYDNDVISLLPEQLNKLKINDEIEIIVKDDNNKRLVKIIEINDIDNTIKINESLNNKEECFVYGSKVDDFHTLDKNYIYTLNVCATQELYKIIQSLTARIEVLEKKLNN